MPLQLYGDLLSQPTRAVALFLKANNIQYEFEPLDLTKGGHRSSEFRAINPWRQVPAIVDDGFNLDESSSILRYLALTRPVPDHWYPADVKERVRVDALLDWYHANLRQTAKYVFGKELRVGVFKYPPIEEVILEEHERLMLASLTHLENTLLTGNGPFLRGASEPSIADIILACEVTQTLVLSKADYEALFGPRPKIRAWLATLEEKFAPHYADVHSKVIAVAKGLEAARSEKSQSSAL